MKWCRFRVEHRVSYGHPADVLWLGTEGAAGDMVPGDVIEVEISGIGVLKNYVVAEA